MTTLGCKLGRTVERMNFRDTGCDKGGPSCLRCPLPECVHDAWDRWQKGVHTARSVDIPHQRAKIAVEKGRTTQPPEGAPE